MDYQIHYDRLVEKYGSWEKPKGVYTERHRKIPGCMGGKYVKGNAFYMSARAHYAAHLLLAKIYTREPGVWMAIAAMSGKHKRKTPSWWYSNSREACLPMWKVRGVQQGKDAVRYKWIDKAIEAARTSPKQKSAARANQLKCSDAVSGSTPMTTDLGKYTTVKLSEVEEKQLLGWIKGHTGWKASTEAAHSKCRGSVHVRLDGEVKRIRPDELAWFLDLGWIQGSGPSDAIKQAKSGTTRMVDTQGAPRYVKLYQVEQRASEGWVLGWKK